MKIILTLAAGFILMSCSDNNLRDGVDANIVPAAQEQRENEFINSPDFIDENAVPASEEEREQEEESIYGNDGLYE